DHTVENGLLQRVHAAVDRAGTWEEFRTDWICLDCELMPWSAKAQDLLRHQYAATGAASRAGLAETVAALEQAAARGIGFVEAAVGQAASMPAIGDGQADDPPHPKGG